MYYFDDMTYEEISVIENCTKAAIKFSIDVAIKNIGMKLKGFVILD